MCINFAFVSNVYAKYSMDECMQVANTLNKNFPMTANSYTTIENTFCEETKNNRVTLVYLMVRDIGLKSKNESIKAITESIKKVTQSMCTTSQTFSLLSNLDIGYNFRSKQGEYLTRFTLKIEDCNQ